MKPTDRPQVLQLQRLLSDSFHDYASNYNYEFDAEAQKVMNAGFALTENLYDVVQ